MESEKRRWWKWVIGAAAVLGALLLVAGVAVWEAKVDSDPPVAAKKPATPENLVIAAFPGWGELRIHRVAVGELAVNYPQKAPRKVGWWKNLFSGGVAEVPTDTGGGGYSSDGRIRRKTDSDNGRVVRRVLSRFDEPALCLEISLHGQSGIPLRLPENRRFFKSDSDSLPDLQAAMTAAGMPLLIQHRDPQSGWIDLQGPYDFDADVMQSSVFTLSAWQRNLENLEFRAIRDDGAVAGFTLRNPDFRKSPTIGAPRPLPQIHSHPDYSIEISGVERHARRGRHPLVTVQVGMKHRSKPDTDTLQDGITLGGMTAEDEWGNRVRFEWLTRSPGEPLGAFLPAASRRMKFHMPILRPTKDSNMVIGSSGPPPDDDLIFEFELPKEISPK